MIEHLKPYAEYKESGLPWLGKIPNHWIIKRGKAYLTCVDERSKTGKEELLTVSSARGVVPRNTASVTMFKAKSYVGYKLCWPGDLAINSLWAWGGGLGVSKHHGIISTAYSVYRARPSANLSPQYLHELVRSAAFNWELHVRSKGIWISRLQLTDTAFLDTPLPVPPPDEQAAIVKFLIYANGKIERAIRAKRKLIGLLNEQKQAIIHRAVTRGLDPNVKLKPSGIPWLGDVPEHWEVVRLGRTIRLITGYPFSSAGFSTSEADMRLLRGVNVTPFSVRWESVVRWSRSLSDGLDPFILKVGDIVLGMDRPIVGSGTRVCEIQMNDVPALLLQRVARLRTTDLLLPSYLLLLLRGRTFADYIAPIFTGISVPHLSPEQIKLFTVALPPKREQLEIVSFVETETSVLETAVNRAEREIDLLREYRTTLTAEVVTGKLDVRDAVKLLPDHADESLPADESLDDLVDDEITEEDEA